MRQQEIWLADLNPTAGSEQSGIRPVVIVSGNAMNDHFRLCIVCPLSSKIKNYAGGIVLEKTTSNGLTQDSEVLTFQIRTLSKSRLLKRIGQITNDDFQKIKTGLNDILTF
ncbi:MAG: type II toxin-antitoxin system PemK/MazF family toxin [Cytophagaceae bacterium]|nr:type II toxin-antitoxin system PemK/MazF family toxin [Cytophagaceae bacterium]